MIKWLGLIYKDGEKMMLRPWLSIKKYGHKEEKEDE